MMSFEDAIKKADEELDRLIYNSECGANAGVRMACSNKAEWFSVIVYLAKKGLQADKAQKEDRIPYTPPSRDEGQRHYDSSKGGGAGWEAFCRGY